MRISLYTMGFCIFVVLTACSGRLPKPEAIDSGRINEQLAVREIAPRAYVVTDESFHNSNVLVAQMSEGTI